MRIALITISILLNIAVLAQKPSKKPNKISFEQKIQIADKLFKEGKTIEAIQSYNIARILAGADNAKHTVVDKKIEDVFRAIEKQKQEIIHSKNLTEDAEREALSQAQLAEENKKDAFEKAELAKANEAKAIKAKEEAEIATNNAKALYWTSEADKINPIQGLRLLEKANMLLIKDTNTIKTIKEAYEDIFKQSNKHQFQEKRKFIDVSKATFSQDSKWLVVKDSNGNNKVLNINQGKIPKFLKNETNIKYAKFSQDSQWLITEDSNGNNKVWNINQEKIPEFLKNEISIKYAKFSQDSQWLVTEDSNGNNKVWNINQEKIPEFLKTEISIKYAKFSQDSQWLVTEDSNGNNKVWNINQEKTPKFLRNETNIKFAKFSYDSKWLIFGYEYPNKTYKVCSLNTFDVYEFITGNNISMDSNLVIVKEGDLDKIETYKVFKIRNRRIQDILKDSQNISDVYFSEKNQLITLKYKYRFKILDVRTGEVPRFLKKEKDIWSATFTNGDYWLITEGSYFNTKVWRISDVGKNRNYFKREKRLGEVFFSLDRKWLVSQDENLNGRNSYTIINSSNPILYYLYTNTKNTELDIVSSSLDNKWMMIKFEDNTYNTLELSTMRTYDFLKGEKVIDRLLFSPDNKWLITIGGQHKNTYKLWDLADGQTKLEYHDNNSLEYSTFKINNRVALERSLSRDKLQKNDSLLLLHSSNQKWIVTRHKQSSDFNFNYKVWDVSTGQLKYFFKDETSFFNIEFSPNGEWLKIKSPDNSYKVWEVSTGQFHVFSDRRGEIFNLDFSPDSKWLKIKYYNNTCNIWEIATGEIPQFLKGGRKFSQIEFSKNGNYLSVRQEYKHKVETYEITTGKLIQILWLNKEPEQIDIIDNRYLYVTIGKGIVKTDLQTQQGNLMSYGDGEELDYEYEEIQEWIKVFGDKYLLPLDEEIKKKYDIK